MTIANPLEASEVTRKLKLAATKRAWCRANPEKQRQYNRTYIESLKLKAADPVEVTLSELVQQVADLKALIMQLVTGRQQTIGSNGGMHPPPPPPVSNR